MILGRVFGAHTRALALVAVVSVSALAAASPAEARRKIHRSGGYNPPYAAMVVDAKTGRVLHAENEDALRHPASVTKVMTLYLLFEQLERGRFRLNSPLRVSAHAQRMAPSKLGLRAGEAIEVEDAIKALVTKSANDVAATVAENIAGSEEEFAELMTRKARQLGMTRTVYRNASGLPDTGQVTTARDLIVLGRAIQDRFPRYYAYFSLTGFSYDGAWHRNHNRLLGRVEGMDGIKTGYTRMSGFNLLTSVKADGRHIVAVVLGGRSAGARDARMAQIIDTTIERAYAGGRTAAPVTEMAVIEAPRPSTPTPPAAVPAAPVRVASASDEAPVTTAAIAPVRPVARPVVDLSGARPVVASAVGTATATPSSAMRWNVGAQPVAPVPAPPVARSEQTRTEPAKPEPVRAPAARAEPARNEPVRVAKAEAKPETRVSREVKSEPPRSAHGGWVIQLGATDDEAKAKDILQRARTQGRGALAHAAPFTEKVSKGGATLWRARFSGFAEDDAQSACRTLKRSGFACFATRG